MGRLERERTDDIGPGNRGIGTKKLKRAARDAERTLHRRRQPLDRLSQRHLQAGHQDGKRQVISAFHGIGRRHRQQGTAHLQIFRRKNLPLHLGGSDGIRPGGRQIPKGGMSGRPCHRIYGGRQRRHHLGGFIQPRRARIRPVQ